MADRPVLRGGPSRRRTTSLSRHERARPRTGRAGRGYQSPCSAMFAAVGVIGLLTAALAFLLLAQPASSLTSDVPHLAVVVPYRDRADQLAVFGRYLHSFLADQAASGPAGSPRFTFEILIVEQSFDDPFNRAALFNAGVVMAPTADYFAFHDVDELPLPGVSFDRPDSFRHLTFEVSRWDGGVPYPAYNGGGMVITREVFVEMNGFSNSFWAWGSEDDEFATRLLRAGYFDCPEFGTMSIMKMPCQPIRGPPGTGRYLSLTEAHTSRDLSNINANSEVFVQRAKDLSLSKRDGLNTIAFEELAREFSPFYTKVTIDLQREAMMEGLPSPPVSSRVAKAKKPHQSPLLPPEPRSGNLKIEL